MTEKMPRLCEIRLSAFKSFKDAVVPVSPVTFLTGLNSSGKSNVLDGLEVLARLATGLDMVEALDGAGSVRGPVRGGARGCAPHGESAFSLGCSVVDASSNDRYDYDVEVQVEPELRLVSERLVGPGINVKSGSKSPRATLFHTQERNPTAAYISAEVFNGKRGGDPSFPFRDTRLILTQLGNTVAGANRAERSVVEAAETVLGVLQSVYHLDPVPSLMRGYVPKGNNELRRTGENLSATLFHISEDNPKVFGNIESLVSLVAGQNVEGLGFATSDLGDVMLALKEQTLGRTPAREMSDGLLRFLAIATTLKTPSRNLDIYPPRSVDGEQPLAPAVQLVIEEIENGLHPSQAKRIIALLQEAVQDRWTQSLVTTHSPAILDGVEGEFNDSVLVCFRDVTTGLSHVSPLKDLPDYTRELSKQTLGQAVSDGKLVDDVSTATGFAELNALFGIAVGATHG